MNAGPDSLAARIDRVIYEDCTAWEKPVVVCDLEFLATQREDYCL